MGNTKAFAILGALLALGLGIFGWQVGRAVRIGREFDRVLAVRGLAEREVKATLVIWPIRFSLAAPDYASLKSDIDASRALVIAYLKEVGIQDEEIVQGLPEMSERRRDRRLADGTSVSEVDFTADVSMVVRSRNVDVVKQATLQSDSLIPSGILIQANTYGNGIEFIFDGLNDVKPSMIAEATASARATAEKFATDSNAQVGEIRKATQGVFEIDSRDIATPEIKTVRVVTSIEFFIK